MQEKTKDEYRKLAAFFYKKHNIDKPTPKVVIDALKRCAPEYRPDYWRRLRSALAFVAIEQRLFRAADKINATKNPMTSSPDKRKGIKPKQKRQKSVSEADEKQLLDFLFEQEERTVFSAITLVSYLGCRPAELKRLQFINGRYIAIPSAKKTDDGKRGLDRIIEIEDSSLFLSLKGFHQMLMDAPYTDPIRYVQRRLDTLTKRLWPKRKVHPSLYSWRHQMGADLKASELPPEEVAAIMGHQSIESVEVYGNPRSAQKSRIYMSPDKGTVRKVQKRNKHRLITQEKEKITLNYLTERVQRNRCSKGPDHGLKQR